MTVGGLELENVETVFCTDLQPLRYATGEDIRGILGVDFLKTYVVTIDFDRGYVCLYETTTANTAAGAAWIPMNVDDSGRPHVRATIGTATNESLLLDTGASGDSVRADLYDKLAQSGAIATSNAQIGLTAGGSFSQNSGYLSDLRVGQLQLGGVRVSRHFENSVGLDWLSRFHVSLDFSNRRILLTKGNRFEEPFSRATSGMAVVDVDRRKIVAQVRPQCPASAAGIMNGDEILAIDGEQAEQLDMFTLGKKLTSNVGDSVDLTIKRGYRSYSTKIRLADRLNSTPM